MSGRIYSGAELYDMGIVDVLAEDGHGEETLNDYVRKNARATPLTARSFRRASGSTRSPCRI